MPDLIPVENDPYAVNLVPVDNDPYAVNLQPVEHDPFGDAPVAKQGQTIQPVNARPMTGQAAMSALGVPDISTMTPDEQQMFALGAVPMLAGGPEAKIAEEAIPEAAQAVKQGIRAFHGSPYDFERFDLSKIGTGEGAQSYGHGLYFAENPAVAQQYKENLAVTPKVNSYNWLSSGAPNRAGQVASELDAKISEEDIRQGLRVKEPQASDDQIDSWIKQGRDLYADASKAGKTYEVNINADPEHFLDWDKPLSEQHPVVQQKIASEFGKSVTKLANETAQGLDGRWYTLQNGEAVGNTNGWPDQGTANAALKIIQQEKLPSKSIQQWLQSSPGAESRLAQAGIPGIKYLDQGSRGSLIAPSVVKTDEGFRVAEQGRVKPSSATFPTQEAAQGWIDKIQSKQTSNYVVFDDRLIDIIKKYGLAGLIAGGAAHFKTTPVDHNPFAAQ